MEKKKNLNKLKTTFIIRTATKISHNNSSLEQIRSIYCEKILSRIIYTSQLFFIPLQYLKRWDTYIYRAIRRALPHAYQSVTRNGLYHLLRILSL